MKLTYLQREIQLSGRLAVYTVGLASAMPHSLQVEAKWLDFLVGIETINCMSQTMNSFRP